jgi:hypothetical protein
MPFRRWAARIGEKWTARDMRLPNTPEVGFWGATLKTTFLGLAVLFIGAALWLSLHSVPKFKMRHYPAGRRVISGTVML